MEIHHVGRRRRSIFVAGMFRAYDLYGVHTPKRRSIQPLPLLSQYYDWVCVGGYFRKAFSEFPAEAERRQLPMQQRLTGMDGL